MPSINMPDKRESGIDKLAKALGIAKDVFGIAVDYNQIKSIGAQMEAKKAEEARTQDTYERSKAQETALGDPTSQQSIIARQEYSKAIGSPIAESVSAQELKSKYGDLASYVLEQNKATQREREIRLKGEEDRRTAQASKSTELANGKQLPPDKVLLVNEGKAIPATLVDIEKTIANNIDVFGPAEGNARSLNPWDDKAKTIDSQMRIGSQQFGRYMEGGVLRKEDEEKYRKMFPQLGDTPIVAQNKLQIVDRLLKRKLASDISALQASGYDVRAFGNQEKIPDLPSTLTQGNTEEGTAYANGQAQVRVVAGRLYVKTDGGWKAQ